MELVHQTINLAYPDTRNKRSRLCCLYWRHVIDSCPRTMGLRVFGKIVAVMPTIWCRVGYRIALRASKRKV